MVLLLSSALKADVWDQFALSLQMAEVRTGEEETDSKPNRNVNPRCCLHSQSMLDIMLDTEPPTTQLTEREDGLGGVSHCASQRELPV